jgi:hypothetical protein
METFDERKPHISTLDEDDKKFFSDTKLKKSIERRATLKIQDPIRQFFKGVVDDEDVLDSNAVLIKTDEYHKRLSKSFDDFSPLMYLSSEQRKAFLEDIKFYRFESNEILYTPTSTCNNAAFILMEGELHFLDKGVFNDLIDYTCFFGYDGPIFKKRFSTVEIERGSIVGVISEKVFIENLNPFSKFCTFIARSIIHKDKILDDLLKFKNFVIEKIDHGNIEINKMVEMYKKTNPCLHPKMSSQEIDYSAWFYSLNRLPQNVLDTFVFVLLNKPPKVLFSKDQLADNYIPRIITKGRNRDVFKFLNGKGVIVVREMETDILDFVSNMCINVIEAKKLVFYLNTPKILGSLFENKDNFEKSVEILENATKSKLNHSEKENLRKFFGDNIGEKLINMCLHYQDYSITISKLPNSDQDPSEKWIQNLWKVSRNLLGVNTSIEEMDDLVVDISQGSKRTLLGCLTPHIFKNKDKILKWGVNNKIKLKTKEFLNENDKLLAFSYYYYKEFPKEQEEKTKMENEHGIRFIEETFSTGIQILIINVNKLNPEYCDPSFKVKPASRNHIILHFGYTFGAQSSLIIKPILMLFGSKARSMNIIGKAGGLTGNRTDILVSSNIFYDKTNELLNINYGNIDIPKLENETKSKVHLGPMLNVAGTILQNNDLLHFYKHVQGCIGIEMEGYFFAREIESCIKHGILRKDFITRCFYYASDLPLDPNQNLAQEDDNVSWDEGVCSMNAIQRFILNQIFSN